MRVLVAMAQARLRATVSTAIETAPDVSCEVVSDTEALFARLGGTSWDVLLTEFDFPGLGGLKGVQIVRAALGDRPLGVFMGGTSLELAKRIMRAGARGVLTPSMGPDAVAGAIRILAAGHALAVTDSSAPLDAGALAGQLSERELQVLTGVCGGLQNKEIAHAFNVQEVTVKMHMRAIIRKLEARNRTHAAMIARDLGIC